MQRKPADRSESHNPASDVMAEVKQLLAENSFGSIDEANAFLANFMQRRNQAPRANFQQLSAEQMHRFIDFPFDSPDLVTFTAAPEGAAEAPIMRLLVMLLEAIGEQGLKLTAAGNLPPKFVRASARAYFGEEWYQEYTKFGDIRTEPHFGVLHSTRLVAEVAGLIRKVKGKFVISRKCSSARAKVGMAGLYPPMLRAFTTRFNWAYNSWGAELPLVQSTFLFTAYVLHRFGDQWRENTFYEAAFLAAFPQTLDEAMAFTYDTPEHTVRNIYSSRALDNFVFLGLAEERPVGDEKERRFEIRKSPLLNAAIRFTL